MYNHLNYKGLLEHEVSALDNSTTELMNTTDVNTMSLNTSLDTSLDTSLTESTSASSCMYLHYSTFYSVLSYRETTSRINFH